MSLTVTAHPEEKILFVEYTSKYSTGGTPCDDPKQLPRLIDEICGKGSYCLYKGKDSEYPKAVDYLISKDLVFPKISYWMQGVKTDLIEEVRNKAEQVWGNIPETRIGWLENQCRSYIEDLSLVTTKVGQAKSKVT